MDPEELEPRKTKVAPRDLDALSVEELTGYVDELEAEIARVKTKIAAKKAYLAGAAGLFGGGKK